MSTCRQCQTTFPGRLVLDGKVRSFQHRKFCLTCSPFGSRNTRDLTKPPYDEIKRDRSATAVSAHRRRTKERAIAYKGGRCCLCGYVRCVAALVFHHRDPAEKEFNLSGVPRAWLRVRAELDKCVLLCANCHAEVHAGLATIPIIADEPKAIALYEPTKPKQPIGRPRVKARFCPCGVAISRQASHCRACM